MSGCTCNSCRSGRDTHIVNSMLQRDPTRTLGLQKRFINALQKRFKLLKRHITQHVETDDCFALNPAPQVAFNARQYEFKTDSDKIQSFMEWLHGQENLDVLEIPEFGSRYVPGADIWTSEYIVNGYYKGISFAEDELRKAGITFAHAALATTFNAPIHVAAVSLIYTRTFNDLKGVTDAMDKEISAVLAEGLARGLNPRQIAVMLNTAVDDIGIKRARMIARTEIVRAHHVASVTRYEEAGIAGVTIKAELMTAGFNVCPVCSSLAGITYTLAEVKGMIPVHPNCRCVVVPIPAETPSTPRRARRK